MKTLKRSHVSKFLNSLLALITAGSIAGSQTANAASATWLGANSGSWSDSTNWNASPVPGTGDTATFNAAVGNATLDLGGGVTISTLLFDSGAGAYTVGSGAVGTQTLTLNNGGAITINSGVTGNELINAGVVLGTDATAQSYTFTNNSTTNSLTVAGGIAGGSTGTAGAKTLTITGAGNTILSGVISNGGASSVVLTKSGAGTLTLSGNNTYTGATALSTGTLNLTGAINSLNTANVGAVTIGNTASSNAVLNISGGTFNATSTATTGFVVGSVANAVGDIQMNSGYLGLGSELHLGGGVGSYGAMTMTSGTLKTGSYLVVGLAGDRAAFNQSGGTVTVAGNVTTIGAGSTSSIGVANLSGGTYTSTGGMYVGEVGVGTLNVSGSAFVAGGAVNIGKTTNAANVGTVNLLGGILTSSGLTKGGALSTGNINFNGGTLKATAASATYMTGLSNAYVFSGGGTIDNGGNAITIGQALLAPTGSGLASGAGLSVTGGSGYVDTPVVTISGGGGSGMTAVATVSGGAVTGITITNPGVGYTSVPTFTLSGGGGSGASVGAGVAALTSNVSGGVVFSGNSTTSLTGASTYTGNTTINGGATVNLGGSSTSGAFSSSSPLVFGGAAGGGALSFTRTDAAGATQTFNGTTLNAGQGTIANATAANTVNLGSITRNAGGLLYISSLSGTTTTSSAVDSTGILGYYVATGAGTSLKYGAGGGGGAITAYSGGTASATAANVTDTTGVTNYDVAAVGALGTSASVNTLRYTGAAGTINGNLTANGLMNAGSGALVYSGTITPGANRELVIFGNTQNTTISAPIGDSLNGASSLIYGGATPGALILGGSNTYTGATIIGAGTLQIGTGSTAGSILNTSSLTNNGILSINRSDSITLASVLPASIANASQSWSGGLTQAGSGILTLGVANSYGGATTVNAGTLRLTNSNAIQNSALTVNSGATLDLRSNTSATFNSGAVAFGAGTETLNLDNNGSGTGQTITLGGAVSANGGTTTINLLSSSGYTLSVGTFNVSAGTGTPDTINAIGSNVSITTLFGNTTNDGLFVAGGNGNFTLNQVNGGQSNRTVYLTVNTSGTVSLAPTGNTQSNTNAGTHTSGITINNGTFVENYANYTNNADLWKNTSTPSLTLGGGAFSLLGRAGNSSQTFGGTTTINSGASSISLTNNGTGALLALAGLTRNVGGTVDITQPTGTLSATNGVTTTAGTASTLLTDSGGAAYATVSGTDWAAKAASTNNIVGLSTVGTYTSDTWNTGNNTDVTTSNAITSAITNTLRFNTAGANTLTLSGSNTITTGGILVTNNVGSNATTITSGTLVGAAGRDLVVIQNNTNGLMTIGSIIGDNTSATAFTKSGSGTLVLSGSNVYTGQTYLNGGTTQVSANYNLGSQSTGATLNLNGATLENTATFGLYNGTVNTNNRLVTLAAKGGTFNTDAGTTLTIAGAVSGAGALTKIGSGTLSLGGANTFTGGVNLTAGKITVTNTAGLGTTGVGAPILISSTGGGTTTLDTTAALNINSNVTISGTSNIINIRGSGNNTANMAINGSLNGSGTVTFDNSFTQNLTLAGNMSNFTGTLILEGNSANAHPLNTYITNAAGTLGNASVIFNQPSNSINYLAWNGAGDTTIEIGALSTGAQAGAGTYAAIQNNIASTTATFSLGNLNTSTTYAGAIQNGTGTVAVTKVGSGRLILSGANSYTGATAVSSGTLQLGSGSAGTFSGGGNSTVANGATEAFGLANSSSYSGNIANSGIVAGVQSSGVANTISGNISGSGAFTQTGAGATLLSGSNTYSGGTTVSSGTLGINSANAIGTGALTLSGGSLDNSSAGALVLATNNVQTWNSGFTFAGSQSLDLGTGAITLGSSPTVTVNANTLTVGGAITGGSFGLTKSGAGTLVLNGANNYTGGTTINAGTLQMGNASALGTTSPSALTMNGGTLDVNGNSTSFLNLTGSSSAVITSSVAGAVQLSATNSAASTFAGAIQDGAGTFSVVKSGTSTLVLSGNNTYTGATTVNEGTLQIGTGNAGSFGGTESTIVAGATEAFGMANSAVYSGNIANSGTLTGIATSGVTNTLSGIISGTGALKVSGGGTIVLSGNNTYSGPTSLVAGTIQLGSDNALGTGVYTPGDGTGTDTTDLNGHTLSNAVLGGGNSSVITNSSSTMATVSSGINKAGAASFLISNFSVNGTGDINWSGAIRRTNGTGTVTKNGNNTLILSGNSADYAGMGYSVNAGSLGFKMSNGAAFNSGGIAVAAGANVVGMQPSGVANTIGQVIFGAGSFTQSGAGTTTLSAVNTYTGATSVAAGKVIVSGQLAGTTSLSVSSGAEINVTGLINTASSMSLDGTLTGSGTVGAITANSGAIVSPGTSNVGNLTVASFSSTTGAHLTLDINGTTAGAYDKLIATTAITLNGGDLTLNLGTFTPGAQTIYLAINNTGGIGGNTGTTGTGFDSITFTGTGTGSILSGNGGDGTILAINGTEYQLTYAADYDSTAITGGNDIALIAVPEPNTWAMMISGFGILLGFQQARRRKYGR